jgi:hypothetical protein
MRDGYEVLIIQKRVSNDLLLYRLEIDGLKNLEQANRTLKTGLENKWLTLEEEQPTEDQGSEQDATY